MKTLLGLTVAIGLVASATPAGAGRGGSLSNITTNATYGTEDSIIASLEQAENLVCPGCVPVVMNLLHDDRYAVREAAAWWFARRPAYKKLLTEEALSDLQSGDTKLVRDAADIVGTFRHPQVLGALEGALDRSDLDAEARVAITRALGTIGVKTANPSIEQAMQDPAPSVRLTALSAWQAIRGQSSAGYSVALMSDDDVTVRRRATALAGVYRQADARLALEAQLSDPDPGVRRNAAWALGQLGDAASREALLVATADESPLVVQVARVALSQLR